VRLLPVVTIALALTALATACSDSRSPPRERTSELFSQSLRDIARCLDKHGAYAVVVESSPQRFVFASFTPRQARLRARITFGIAVAPGSQASDQTRLSHSLEAVTEGGLPAHHLPLNSARFVGAASGPHTSPSVFAHGADQALAERTNLAARKCVRE
jgi:hypothetical protein